MNPDQANSFTLSQELTLKLDEERGDMTREEFLEWVLSCKSHFEEKYPICGHCDQMV